MPSEEETSHPHTSHLNNDSVWCNKCIIDHYMYRKLKLDSLTDVTVGLLHQILYHVFVSSYACQVKRRPVVLIPHICTTHIMMYIATNVQCTVDHTTTCTENLNLIHSLASQLAFSTRYSTMSLCPPTHAK